MSTWEQLSYCLIEAAKRAITNYESECSQSTQQNLTLKATDITLNDFKLVINASVTLYSFSCRWIAFLDENMYSQFGDIYQTITSQNAIIQIQILNQLSYIPNAALFLNGISLQTPTNTQYQFKFQIYSTSRTEIKIEANLLPGFIVQCFSYQVIYGSPKYLYTGSLESTILGSILTSTIDSKTKVTIVGLIGLQEQGSITIRITNTDSLANITTWSGTVTSYVISYFNYMPCPLYCTTCSVASPNCDGCLASTQRIGNSCTTCQTGTYLPSSESIDCLTCGSYCAQCSGGAIQCTACLPISLRIGIPNCTTCPSQKFAQQGILICQSINLILLACAIYCNECQISQINCTSCKANTLRSNPPTCSCPAQFHSIQNYAICQPCLAKCNNCLDYSSHCIACSQSSMRIDPPNCITCPSNMFVNLDTCTQCDLTCQTCDLSGCLTCLTNQYIDSFHKCSNCPTHCLTCDINTCYQCTNNCSQCDLISCLKCPDNYYISGTNCIKCDDNCLKCDSQGCSSCQGIILLINHQCQCQSPCLTCNSIQCLSCISPDYRLNNDNCQYCPSRCIACDSKGSCLTGLQNCQSGLLIGDSNIQCSYCKTGYFLDYNACLPCQSQCMTCSIRSQNCTTCRFRQISQSECKICEQELGLYSDFNNNQCYTICGDGLIAGIEECDDGNPAVKDGCTNCQIDQGFTCSEMICYQLIYPTPTLTQILTYDSIYNSTKSFLLSYNIPLRISNIQMSLSIIGQINLIYNYSQIDSHSFIIRYIIKFIVLPLNYLSYFELRYLIEIIIQKSCFHYFSSSTLQ